MKHILLSFLAFFVLNLQVQALTITEDFSSTTYFDTSNSTAIWNIGLGYAHSPFAVAGSAGAETIDIGDGSDGECLWDNQSINAGTYNCTELTVSGTVTVAPVAGNPPMIIKVQGNVNIAAGAVLSVNGANGHDGYTSTTLASNVGGTGGTGGSDGGTCVYSSDYMLDCTGAAGDGQGAGKGAGGTAVAASGLGGVGGGGGGGGRYAGTSLPSNGSDGIQDGTASQGLGGLAGGANYGDQANFSTINSFLGGSGGGAGGAGDNDAGNPQFQASGSGGGGGGALRISAGGTINVAAGASITANGGDGGNGVQFSGGGGGGSGGALFLQSLQEITLAGSLSAVGGNGGTGGNGGVSGGNGGDGGDGRIRLDALGGSVSVVGAGSITPNAQNPSGTNAVLDVEAVTDSGSNNGNIILQSLALDFTGENVRYLSLTVDADNNGGSIDLSFAESDDGNSWSSWVDGEAGLQTLSKRYIRWRATLTLAGDGTSPLLRSVIIDGSALTAAVAGAGTYSSSFKGLTCATMNIENDQHSPRGAEKNMIILSFLMGIALIIILRKIVHMMIS